MARFIVDINEMDGNAIGHDLAWHIAEKFGKGIVTTTCIIQDNDGQFLD